jgi:hypothetical protein
MLRLRTLLVLAAMLPVGVVAQRHSGDCEQFHHAKPPNPILNIDNRTTKTWNHPRLSEIVKMKSITVDIPDPKAKRDDVYEGVTLDELAPNATGRRVDVFKDTWGLRDRLAMSNVGLDYKSEVIVAYSKNGKRLAEHPFCLIAKNAHGNIVIVRNLSYIRLQ